MNPRPTTIAQRAARMARRNQPWYRQDMGSPLILAVGLTLSIAIGYLLAGDTTLLPFVLAAAVPAFVIVSRFPAGAILIWMLVVPYFVSPTGEAGLVFNLVHRTLIPGALLAVIVTGWARSPRAQRFRPGVAEAAMLAYLALVTLNLMLYSADTNTSLIRLYDRAIVPMAAYLLIRVTQPTTAELGWAVPAALVTVLVQAVVGTLSWVAPGVLPHQWLDLVGVRTVGTLGNPNSFSVAMVFGAMVFFAWRRWAGARGRLLIAAVLVLAGFFVFLSFARASWLGGLLVVGGLIVGHPRLVLPWAAAVGVIAVLLGATVFTNEVAFAQQRLATESTAESRIIGDVASLRMIAAEPVLGWGYNNYNLYWDRFKENVGDILAEAGGTSHNAFLTIAAETGLFALLLFVLPTLWWLGISLRDWLRSRDPGDGAGAGGGGRAPSRSNHIPVLELWLVIAFAMVIANFTDTLRFEPFITVLWWSCLGVIANAIDTSRAPRQAAPAAVPIWRRSGAAAVLAMAPVDRRSARPAAPSHVPIWRRGGVDGSSAAAAPADRDAGFPA